MTLRAVLIGLAANILFSLAIPVNDYYLRGTYITGNHFPLGAVVILVALVLGVNVPLRRWRPRWALQKAELIVVWVMITIASGIPSSGLMRYLVPYQVGFYYLDNPTRQWDQAFHQHIPEWLAVSKSGTSDPVVSFYEGLPETASIPWEAWLRPMASWLIFFVALYWLMFSLCALLQRQWATNERLAFPLVQIPLAMIEDPEPGAAVNRFFRSPILWVGVSVAACIQGLNGLHAYFPLVPNIPLDLGLQAIVRASGTHWHGVHLWSTLYPSVIGVAFLLTSEVSFSLWFFYLLLQAQFFMARAYGAPFARADVTMEQAGAYLVFGLGLLWVARHHLWQVLRRAVSFARSGTRRTEAAAEAWSLFGLVASTAIVVWWYRRVGMSATFAWLSTFLLVGIFIILTRVVSEAGLLFVQATWLKPFEVCVHTVGAANIPAADLTHLGLQAGLFHDARELVMPSAMNSMRMSDAAPARTRGLRLAMWLAIAATLIVSAAAMIRLFYRYGAVNLQSYGSISTPTWVSNAIAASIRNPKKLDARHLVHAGAGFLTMGAILLCRARFYWFRIHPVGLVMANSYPMMTMWFSILVAWVCKVTILWVSGGAGYRKARDFFLGLVIGDCLMGGLWIILGFIWAPVTPIRILPG